MKRTYSLVLASLLIAVGIVSSIICHSVGIGGQVILPLHYSALLAGFILGGWWGGLVGLLLPGISTLITGMPPLIPSAILMIPELAVYGMTAGFLRKSIGIYPALFAALIAGRLVYGLGIWVLTPVLGLHLSVLTSITGSIIVGVPGIITQIIIIPILVKRIKI